MSVFLTLALCAPLQAAPAADSSARSAPARPNLVLIVLDDVGVDRLGLYGEVPAGASPPSTPNIDALAAAGVLFRHCYANPLCSPTRAQILTGRHGFRTGIGALVQPSGTQFGLSAEHELILPELLTGYDSALVGKWHLAHPTLDGVQHPLASGFKAFAGSLYNLGDGPVDCGDIPPECQATARLGYYNWVKTWDPRGLGRLEQTWQTTYATTDTADGAIAHARAMHAPWFLEVAFNAAHEPAQRPPPYLVPHPSESEEVQEDVHDAVIEALDTELGRTLAGIRAVDPGAIIVLLSDNGTYPRAARGEAGSCFGRDRSKGTLYEGGIRVPLIVAGPGVVRGTCDALVSVTDLFATFAELAHVGSKAEDSISLVPYLRGHMQPLRSTVYCEFFQPNAITPDAPSTPDFAPLVHRRVVRNARYKLFRNTEASGIDELFFDLAADPCEEHDLAPEPGPCDPERLTPEQAANYRALQAELVRLGVY